LCKLPAEIENHIVQGNTQRDLFCYKMGFTTCMYNELCMIQKLIAQSGSMASAEVICLWEVFDENIGRTMIHNIKNVIRMNDAGVFWADGTFIRQCTDGIRLAIRQRTTDYIKDSLVNQLDEIKISN
jgi:hypothetical protein